MKLPQGKGFAPRFLVTIILIGVAFLGLILFVMGHYGGTRNKASTASARATSKAASADIDRLQAQRPPVLLLDQWQVYLNGKTYPILDKDGQLYVKGPHQEETPLQDGALVYNHAGVPYQYRHGQFASLQTATPKVGDLMEKNGKLYRLGQDGQWHPYTAPLRAGQVVWKDGKAYVVGQDGHLHAVGSQPQTGDLKEQGGKLYQLGKDGKWHPYAGQLHPGQIVWKDGKAYAVDANGHLRAIGRHPSVGDLVEKNGALYQVGQDGHLHPYLGQLTPGQVVWKDGQRYVVGANGRLIPAAHTHAQETATLPVGAKPGDYVKVGDKLYRVGANGQLIPYRGTLPAGATLWQDGIAHQIGVNGTIHAEEKTSPQTGSPQGNKQVAQALQAAKSPLIAIHHTTTAAKATHSAASSSATQFEKNSLNLLAAQNRTLAQLGQHGDAYATQNNQGGKIAFLKTAQANAQDVLKQTVHTPSSPYTLFAGTLLPATLITGINSDLPGEIIAQVSENVYDTVSGNYLLIPQGTRLLGNYDSQISYGQSRVLIAWHRLIMPNGENFDLSGMPGADLMGAAGLTDQVNHHYVRLFGSALMFSVFGALGQLSQPNTTTNGFTNQQIIYGAIGQQLTQTAMQRLARDMNIQPTIKIRPGDNFNVLITRDVVLPHPYNGYGRG